MVVEAVVHNIQEASRFAEHLENIFQPNDGIHPLHWEETAQRIWL